MFTPYFCHFFICFSCEYSSVAASPLQTHSSASHNHSSHHRILSQSSRSSYHGNVADQLHGRALWPQESWPLAWESSEEEGRGEERGPCLKMVKALHWLAIICPFRSPICVIGILTNWTFCTLLAAPSTPVYTGQGVLLVGVGAQWWSPGPSHWWCVSNNGQHCFHFSWSESADGTFQVHLRTLAS